jgi:amidophosphoribosyltransferase
VYEAVGATRATHCDACFSGDYPLAGSDDAAGKYSLEDRAPSEERLPSLPLVNV